MSNAFPCSPSRRENSPPKLSPLPAKGKGFRRGGTTKENPAFSRDSLRCAIIPFPITRRSNGDCQLGSSPGSRSSLLCAFPRKTPQ